MKMYDPWRSVTADQSANELESAAVTGASDAVADAVNADESIRFAVSAGRRLLAGGGEPW